MVECLPSFYSSFCLAVEKWNNDLCFKIASLFWEALKFECIAIYRWFLEQKPGSGVNKLPTVHMTHLQE